MTIPMIKLVNAETGEEIEREMNAQELAVYEADLLAYKTKQEESQKAELNKIALLAKLGITADEAKLLLS